MRRFLVVRIRVSRTKAAMVRIRERVRANKCVTCECETDQANDANSACLQCESCRAKLRRILEQLPKAKKERLLERLIREGFLIPAGELRVLRAAEKSRIQAIFDEIAERN